MKSDIAYTVKLWRLCSRTRRDVIRENEHRRLLKFTGQKSKEKLMRGTQMYRAVVNKPRRIKTGDGGCDAN